MFDYREKDGKRFVRRVVHGLLLLLNTKDSVSFVFYVELWGIQIITVFNYFIKNLMI